MEGEAEKGQKAGERQICDESLQTSDPDKDRLMDVVSLNLRGRKDGRLMF